ncbi:MAG TPA: NADH-quinone oxidoreductase subunit NuoB [Gemmatimonadota bacterium]|nr:NADH-quinone oxidoreductase subunit NuoB [Gemmatimonadota bacterium]
MGETKPPESVFTTTLDKMVRWARAGSLWPLPFGTACCAIEFMSVVSSHYDLARFGAEVVRFSPRQSDMMIVAGTVVDKQAPILKLIYEQMASPKWVISMGVCASSGGFYRAYHVMQGIDEIVPVDVYVPGCPPTPEGLIYAILKLQEKVQHDTIQGRERAALPVEQQPIAGARLQPAPAESAAAAAPAPKA